MFDQFVWLRTEIEFLDEKGGAEATTTHTIGLNFLIKLLDKAKSNFFLNFIKQSI